MGAKAAYLKLLFIWVHQVPSIPEVVGGGGGTSLRRRYRIYAIVRRPQLRRRELRQMVRRKQRYIHVAVHYTSRLHRDTHLHVAVVPGSDGTTTTTTTTP